jgi:fructan beta-fructosidase
VNSCAQCLFRRRQFGDRAELSLTPRIDQALDMKLPILLLLVLTALSQTVTGEDKAARPFTEEWRPRFHFSAMKSGLGDPNGLFFQDGKWHLQYQTGWPRSWGQASSGDLLHWEELPLSLASAGMNDGCWSGGTVQDGKNTSGFFAAGAGGLISLYTAHRQDLKGKPGEQSIALASSADGGQTWKRYEKNPVLVGTTPNFRDPKVFWHEPTARWIMLLTEGHSLSFFASANLREWSQLSSFQPPRPAEITAFECPDLFHLPVEGKAGASKWVLSTSYLNEGNFAGPFGFGLCEQEYFVGEFDGTTFRAEGAPQRLGAGPDEYAAITWPRQTDPARTLLIGWMSHWGYASKEPTNPWKGHMTLPRELTLRETAAGEWQLSQAPARELWTLPHEILPTAVKTLDVQAGRQVLGKSRCAALRVVVQPADKSIIEFEVFASTNARTKVGCDLARKIVYLDRRTSGSPDFHPNFATRHEAPLLPSADGRFTFDLIIDHATVEVFANHGTVYLSGNVFPDPQGDEISMRAVSGSATIESLELRAFR